MFTAISDDLASVFFRSYRLAKGRDGRYRLSLSALHSISSVISLATRIQRQHFPPQSVSPKMF
jgi:hypothetical protein